MAETTVSLTVNGRPSAVQIDESRTLLYLIREVLGLKGSKEGCGEGVCGACTVLLDGQAVNACLVLAVQAEGKELYTIEGLGAEEIFILCKKRLLKLEQYSVATVRQV